MSNVKPRTTSVKHRTVVASKAQGCAHVSPPAHASPLRPRWAVRPLAAGEPPACSQVALAKAALGCPSVGGQRAGWRGARRCARVGRGPRRVRCKAVKDTIVRTTDTAAVFNGNAPVWPVVLGREGGTYMSQPSKSLASCGGAPPSGKAGQASVSVPRSFGYLAIKRVGRSGAACRSERSFIAPGPNPSIEGTSTSKLRLLAAAPHVKR